MLKTLAICLATLFLAPAAQAQSAPPMDALIDATLAPLIKPDGPGAVIIVTKAGKPVFRKAYGMADVPGKAPMQPDMQLRLGSVTKQFTAVGILMLAEEGKLSVQDDITRFFPDYPTRGQRITIEQLLQHTSGIRNFTLMANFGDVMNKDLNVAQMIDFFKNEPRDFAPGEGWRYSNSGYFLLGAIIEKVSGMRYADFMATRIFEPLGMQDTAYEGHERSAKRRTAGYRLQGKEFIAVRDINMQIPFAAAAIVSTVDDMARWDAAISAGKLLKPASWVQAFTPCKLPKNAPCEYGYGWRVTQLRGHKVAAHSGIIAGFTSQVLRLPDDQIYVAVLTNGAGGAIDPEALACKAAAVAIGDPYPERKAVALRPEALDDFVGVYQLEDKNKRTIRRDGSRLTMQQGDRDTQVLTPYGSNSFFLEGTLVSIEFMRAANGTVERLLLKSALIEQPAVRVADIPRT